MTEKQVSALKEEGKLPSSSAWILTPLFFFFFFWYLLLHIVQS